MSENERDSLLAKWPALTWEEFERLKILLEEEMVTLRANADPKVIGWALQVAMIRMKQYEILDGKTAEISGWKEVAKLNE